MYQEPFELDVKKLTVLGDHGYMLRAYLHNTQNDVVVMDDLYIWLMQSWDIVSTSVSLVRNLHGFSLVLTCSFCEGI